MMLEHLCKASETLAFAIWEMTLASPARSVIWTKSCVLPPARFRAPSGHLGVQLE